MSNIPAELKYSNDHEWCRVEGEFAYVGITDFAQSELGDIVFVDIQTEGETLAAGDIFGTIEAVKTVSDAFTPVSGEVAISVGVIRVGKKEQKALFSIRNTGEGIPSEELPHVFERFYKTDRSRGLDKSGTGLGLYIARTSIRNHGEDITVDSVVNEYTEFRFTLPYIEKTPGR